MTKTTQTASTILRPSVERGGSTLTRHSRTREEQTVHAGGARLEDGDTAGSPLAEFLGVLDGLYFGVKAVYLNRGFYDSKCLTLLQAHNYAYVIPVIQWGEAIQQELSEGWSRVIDHDLAGNSTGTAGPSSSRLSEQTIATTTTRDATVRLLYVVVSLLLQNTWRYLHYEYVAPPHRGGRRLWWWPYKEFINMVRRAAWTALAVRLAVPANGPPNDRVHR